MCKGCCKNNCAITMITKVLVVIGGINWGLVGLGMLLGHADEWNLVKMVLGSMPVLEAVVYALVGVSALIMIFDCKCKKCFTNDCVCPAEEAAKVSETPENM